MFVIYSSHDINRIFTMFFLKLNQLKNYGENIIIRSLFFMTMVLAILIFFIKKKREINFEIYHENKKLVKYIQLKLKYNYKLSAVLSKNDKI